MTLIFMIEDDFFGNHTGGRRGESHSPWSC